MTIRLNSSSVSLQVTCQSMEWNELAGLRIGHRARLQWHDTSPHCSVSVLITRALPCPGLPWPTLACPAFATPESANEALLKAERGTDAGQAASRA